jgi:hypothetical protein
MARYFTPESGWKLQVFMQNMRKNRSTIVLGNMSLDCSISHWKLRFWGTGPLLNSKNPFPVACRIFLKASFRKILKSSNNYLALAQIPGIFSSYNFICKFCGQMSCKVNIHLCPCRDISQSFNSTLILKSLKSWFWIWIYAEENYDFPWVFNET